MAFTIFSRGVGDTIRIGDDVILRVEKIDRTKVILAVEAPNSMPVYLKEVFEAIQRESGNANK
jgi:carbon storage regulator CsrA